MRSGWLVLVSLAVALACSDAEPNPTPSPRGRADDATSSASEPSSPPGARSALPASAVAEGAEGADGPEVTEVGALTPGTSAPSATFIMFSEPETGFLTDRVHDADSEVVHFDARLAALISSESGDAVGGWTVSGVNLSWSRGGSFRVRFGTEEGERRAYFTEAGPGTICNLTVAGPDALFINATRETPPNP